MRDERYITRLECVKGALTELIDYGFLVKDTRLSNYVGLFPSTWVREAVNDTGLTA